MKTCALFAVVMVYLCIAKGHSQTNAGTIPFDTITPKGAQEAINAMEGQESRRDFAFGALKSKRTDLIEVCFQNQYTMGWIRDGVRDLPASRFKDEMVVLMLKSDSPFWPPDGFVIQGSRAIGPMVVEPFAGVAKAHLPSLIFSESMLKSRRTRLNLAQDIERAVRTEETNPRPATPNRAMPTQAEIPPVTSPATTTGRSTERISETPAGTPSAPMVGSRLRHSALIGVLVLLALGGGLWAVVKAKSK